MELKTRYGDYGIHGAKEANLVEVCAATRAELEELRAAFPKLRFFELGRAGRAGYAVSLSVPRNIVGRIVQDLVLEIDDTEPIPAEHAAAPAGNVRRVDFCRPLAVALGA